MPKQRKPLSLMEIHKNLERISGKKIPDMNLFELSIAGIMPSDIYNSIKARISLAVDYLEDGAVNTSLDILRTFLKVQE
jgi:hypothetical protein